MTENEAQVNNEGLSTMGKMRRTAVEARRGRGRFWCPKRLLERDPITDVVGLGPPHRCYGVIEFDWAGVYRDKYTPAQLLDSTEEFDDTDPNENC